MPKKTVFKGSILLTSLHGYVAASPELGKPDTGGQVLYILEVARRFFRLGYRVDIVTRRFDNQRQVDQMGQGMRVWRVPYGPKGFIRKEDQHDYLGEFITNFLNLVRRMGIKYDVAYSHYWDAGWATQKVAEQLQIPHIHTPHSLGWWKREIMPGSERHKESIYRFKERLKKEYMVYQVCDHIIATTKQQSQLLQSEYGILPEKISVVPPGMDENKFTPIHIDERENIQKKHDLKSTDVLALGRMATNKGFDLLIRALPILIKLVPKARLIAAFGSKDSARDKSKIKKLKELAKDLGVSRRIQWRGYIENNDLVSYYCGTGVFALSSRYEPFGMTAIEAMACGTPTVISVHGGLFKLVNFGTHALYADPKRPDEYGVMLALPMLHQNLSTTMSAEGARFARRNFGWTGIARNILNIFEGSKSKYIREEDEEISSTPDHF